MSKLTLIQIETALSDKQVCFKNNIQPKLSLERKMLEFNVTHASYTREQAKPLTCTCNDHPRGSPRPHHIEKSSSRCLCLLSCRLALILPLETSETSPNSYQYYLRWIFQKHNYSVWTHNKIPSCPNCVTHLSNSNTFSQSWSSLPCGSMGPGRGNMPNSTAAALETIWKLKEDTAKAGSMCLSSDLVDGKHVLPCIILRRINSISRCICLHCRIFWY